MEGIRLRRGRGRAGWIATGALALALPQVGVAETPTDLTGMDLEDLMDVEVTSVSKRAQRIGDSPAAVTVISEEDIRRSGATTLPELLRMAPGVHVAHIDATHWSVSTRGFADEFSNKLLVMVDGRSVYTPLFSGVLWSEHDLMLEDIERIEIVRGPGGTLWGANAVNGVIHVITKSAAESQGVLLTSRGGSTERFGSGGRYGGAIGDSLHYRVYGKFVEREEFDDAGDATARDDWQSIRSGGRLDWRLTESDLFTLQGDFYDGDVDRSLVGGLPDEEDNTGGNALARFTHTFSPTSSVSLQGWWDRTDREQSLIEEERDTFDVELQHGFQPLPRNQITWGAGYRSTSDQIDGSPAISFGDDSERDDLVSLFVQDEIEVLSDLLYFTLGSKFERNDYTDFEFQPSGRLMFTPHARHSFWGAVSRAVRTPSRADDDVIFTRQTSPTDFQVITGSTDFDSEELLAYEVGYRVQPLDRLDVDLAAFYNDYDQLRTAEVTSVIIGPPNIANVVLSNEMHGHAVGFEASSGLTVTDFWRLRLDYTFTELELELSDGSTDVTAENAEGTTPLHQVALRSHVVLPRDFGFDGTLAWVDELDTGNIDDYVRLDLRLSWRPLENLELSLVGQNLADPHQEFGDGLLTQATQVPRGVYGGIRWLGW